jgi:hypothetical protein
MSWIKGLSLLSNPQLHIFEVKYIQLFAKLVETFPATGTAQNLFLNTFIVLRLP